MEAAEKFSGELGNGAGMSGLWRSARVALPPRSSTTA